jgi:hypothetical protein
LENVVLIFNDEDLLAYRAWHSWWREPTREKASCQDARANCVDGAGSADVRWMLVICGYVRTNVAMYGVKERWRS